MITRRKLLKTGAAMTTLPFGLTLADNSSPRITKVIPSSGERIPVIGIGTNRYGVGDDQQALKPLRETLNKFAEFGGGLIDTAPMYRSSETVLGNLINELNLSDQFFIATKCDVEGGDETRKQLHSSREKLQSDGLDLVAVHSLKHWKKQLPVLKEAKASNEIRYIGVTTSRGSQHQEVVKVMQQEPLDFVQVNYSLGDRAAEDTILGAAQEKGIAVMANLSFGRGKLFKAVNNQSLPEWVSEFDATSWAQVFLKYVVSHPAVTCSIPGTTKVHHLIDNMGAAMGRLPDAKQRLKLEQWFDKI